MNTSEKTYHIRQMLRLGALSIGMIVTTNALAQTPNCNLETSTIPVETGREDLLTWLPKWKQGFKSWEEAVALFNTLNVVFARGPLSFVEKPLEAKMLTLHLIPTLYALKAKYSIASNPVALLEAAPSPRYLRVANIAKDPTLKQALIAVLQSESEGKSTFSELELNEQQVQALTCLAWQSILDASQENALIASIVKLSNINYDFFKNFFKVMKCGSVNERKKQADDTLRLLRLAKII